VEPEAVKKQLRERHSVHVWVSPLSSTRIDMERRGLRACVRSSVHCYNTEEEVDRLIGAAHML
jgi:cysteine desulfurase / selenocysteine lyase